jgi:hypothetical protein
VLVVAVTVGRRDRTDTGPRHLAFNAVIVAVGVLVAAFVAAAHSALTA